MRYVLIAPCAKEISVCPARLKQWPVLHGGWSVGSYFFVALCYIGLFTAVIFVEMLPFKLVRMAGLTPDERTYRLFAGIIFISLVGFSCLLAMAIYRHFKFRQIHLDLTVLFVGSLVALLFAWVSQ